VHIFSSNSRCSCLNAFQDLRSGLRLFRSNAFSDSTLQHLHHERQGREYPFTPFKRSPSRFLFDGTSHLHRSFARVQPGFVPITDPVTFDRIDRHRTFLGLLLRFPVRAIPIKPPTQWKRQFLNFLVVQVLPLLPLRDVRRAVSRRPLKLTASSARAFLSCKSALACLSGSPAQSKTIAPRSLLPQPPSLRGRARSLLPIEQKSACHGERRP
jgi:hypothetical protein